MLIFSGLQLSKLRRCALNYLAQLRASCSRLHVKQRLRSTRRRARRGIYCRFEMLEPRHLMTIGSQIAIISDTGASATDGITSDNALVLAGMADAEAIVTISREDLGALGTATADDNGLWQFDYTDTPLADGD